MYDKVASPNKNCFVASKPAGESLRYIPGQSQPLRAGRPCWAARPKRTRSKPVERTQAENAQARSRKSGKGYSRRGSGEGVPPSDCQRLSGLHVSNRTGDSCGEHGGRHRTAAAQRTRRTSPLFTRFRSVRFLCPITSEPTLLPLSLITSAKASAATQEPSGKQTRTESTQLIIHSGRHGTHASSSIS